MTALPTNKEVQRIERILLEACEVLERYRKLPEESRLWLDGVVAGLTANMERKPVQQAAEKQGVQG